MCSTVFWLTENIPTLHTTQVPSVLFSCFPALHAEQDALPLSAVRPALQFEQCLASVFAAKVFMVHNEQCI